MTTIIGRIIDWIPTAWVESSRWSVPISWAPIFAVRAAGRQYAPGRA